MARDWKAWRRKHKRTRKKPRLAVDRRYRNRDKPRAEKTLIIIHSTEGHDREGTSDVTGVLDYLHNKGYGIHFVIDKEGNIGQGAPTDRIVSHAAGINTPSIGIELIGFARFPRWMWLRRRRQLRKLAILLAWLSKTKGIPLHHSEVKGVAKHADFPAGGHTDPGKGFPFNRVLRTARAYKKRGWKPQ